MKVLYLSPAEGEPTGLAAYAVALRAAAAQSARLELVPGSALGATGISYRANGLAAGVAGLVARWRRSGDLEPFDIVQVDIGGGSYREYHFARVLTRLRESPPVVITLHDPPFTVGRTLSERWPARLLPARALRRAWELTAGLLEERRMLEGAGAIITLSRSGAEALRRRFPRLPVPITPIEHIAFPGAGGDADAASARPTDEITILWLGFPARESGLDLLFAALGAIAAGPANGLPPWRVEIAGPLPEDASGLARAVERRGLASRIQLRGFVPDAELNTLFARSQILVIPRGRRGRLRHELRSVSGSMIRAMSAGLAVVAADSRAAAEEIVSGKSGLLVAPGDERGLADAIRSLLGDAALRARLGREAQHHVRQSHAPDKIVADHVSVYRSVLRNAGGPGRAGERRPAAAGSAR